MVGVIVRLAVENAGIRGSKGTSESKVKAHTQKWREEGSRKNHTLMIIIKVLCSCRKTFKAC